ncbi:MAG: 2-oxo acid dehydrogenase subunit E2 [Xanthomonadales bacterium]|nr:2-oxo acid dehydrogenase subunit E2 [Xanthomonadales bacterium]NIN59307.1 2-oxo acid dehydrogenase subunit E2 [Xanthomonadales bacterium]NIN74669.1 2-oxo acid dehydrogenase subunit E2 [Xanthomonadales bacterium]NIO13335.1 2-oxo acid dehydrogenase subunit E2 [Xanthomonadales bacterium]NIP11700.1 2-oxo acid dehydrogenase subunit E2 [Xanthomonadales bacterium]
MKIFYLPDLGEGLPDAEIVEWLVKVGDAVKTDDPLVSMETAKAVVEVPSPYTGTVAKLFGQAGDVIETGKPLAGFEVEGEAADAGHEEPAPEPKPEAEPEPEPAAEEPETGPMREDFATVVGSVEVSDTVVTEGVTQVAGVKVTPAVRALARKLGVDLASVSPSGRDGVVTRADVERAAASPAPAGRRAATPQSALPPRIEPSGAWEPIRGTRRTMARVMTEAHRNVVHTSIMDDADIHRWNYGQDITVRLLRSLWAGARAEPGLNAWYDSEQNMRLVHKGMDAGLAIDTEDGLFVAAVRNIHALAATEVRAAVDRLRDNVANRSIPPADLKDYTIMLSNVGVFAGRYATPIITPPCVCIVAAGKLRHEVVPVLGGFEVHRMLPLSVTFDHRAVTGGEAARFLRAMLEDLARPD